MERVAALRRAFATTIADKAFIADAGRIAYTVQPISGDEVARIVHETVTASPAAIAKAKAVIGSAGGDP